MSAGARADAAGLKEGHALFWFQMTQPSCRSQTGKASTDYSKVRLLRRRLLLGGEIDCPGRDAPSRGCLNLRELSAHVSPCPLVRYLGRNAVAIPKLGFWGVGVGKGEAE